MKLKNGDKRALLEGVILFLIILIIIFIFKMNHLYDLEQETYNKLLQMITINGETKIDQKMIGQIVSEFEEKKQAIDKEVIMNGIKGFFLTLALVLTSVSAIVENMKNILKSVKSFTKGKKSETEDEQGKCHVTPSVCPVEVNKEVDILQKHINIYKDKQLEEILRLLSQLNEIDREGMSKEKQELIQKTTSLLVEKLIDHLNETFHFTTEIHNDKEQLVSGVHEIRKGVEQISQIVLEKNGHERVTGEEDIVAAVQQINTVIEEIGNLLLGMENKVQKLTKKIENQRGV